MKFDSNQAWQEAAASVSANREVVFPIAGVFFLLPSLAFALLLGEPAVTTGMAAAQVQKAAMEFYGQALPWFLPVALFQGIGSLALYALLTDRTRPTVGEALRLGAAGFLPYIASQLLLGLGLGLAGVVLAGIAVSTGIAALAAVVIVLLLVGMVYVMIKTALVSPVIMIEGQRNPIAALKRSWALTKGNSARLALFLFLVFVAFMVVSMIVGMIAGGLAAVVGGPEIVRGVSALVSSLIGASLTLYMVAIFASIHRQLAGGSPSGISATFD